MYHSADSIRENRENAEMMYPAEYTLGDLLPQTLSHNIIVLLLWLRALFSYGIPGLIHCPMALTVHEGLGIPIVAWISWPVHGMISEQANGQAHTNILWDWAI